MLHYCCIMVTNEHEEQRRINKCNSVRGIRIEMKQRCLSGDKKRALCRKKEIKRKM